MQNSSSTKNLVIALVVVILIAVGYYIFTQTPAPDNGALDVTAAGGDAGSADLLPLLTELQSLKFNTGIFNDQSFLSLKDSSVEILQQPVGRDNPFLPFAISAAPETKTAAAKKK